MKYRINNSDLFIDGKLYPENSEVDLIESQTKGIESFLIPVSHPEFISGSESVSDSSSELNSNTNNEIKSKSKGNKK